MLTKMTLPEARKQARRLANLGNCEMYVCQEGKQENGQKDYVVLSENQLYADGYTQYSPIEMADTDNNR